MEEARGQTSSLKDGRKSSWKGWLAVVAIFVVAPFAGLSLLWHDRCHETILSQLPAAGGAVAAEILVKDCGPSMAPATIVRVGQKSAEPGAALKDDEMVLLLHGKVGVEATWQGDQALKLSVPRSATVVTYEPLWQDVKIELKKS
jgi:hypothetical protein